jgi:nitroreductase
VDLLDGLRTTGAVRDFSDRPVPDDMVETILEHARFAPSGGNRQGWRVVVVKDGNLRRALRDLYLPAWYDYLAQAAAGLVAWAPVTDLDAERRALGDAGRIAGEAAGGPGGMAEHLDVVPVLLVLLADLRVLAATDRDLDRYTLVGGASIYPFAWSVLLAARAAGLGGVLTTMLTRKEDAVRRLLGVPDHFAVAGAIVLGYPERRPTRLRRAAVPEFATVDRFDGAPFGGGG